MLSYHSQHFQHYRAWMTLLFSVFSFKLPSMYGSTTILVLYAHSTFCQFVHRVISCNEEWWSYLASFHAMEQSHGISDQPISLELGPNLGSDVQTALDQRHQWISELVSLSGDVALLLLHHDYICLQYVKRSDMSAGMPSDTFQGVNKRVSGFTILVINVDDTMFSTMLLWQWDFEVSVMSCYSKVLEYCLSSNS